MAEWKAPPNSLPTNSELLAYTILLELTLESKPGERDTFMAAVNRHMKPPTDPLDGRGGESTVWVAPLTLTNAKTLVSRTLSEAMSTYKEDVLTSVATAMVAYDGLGRMEQSFDASTLRDYLHHHEEGRYHGPLYTARKKQGQPRATAALHLIVDKMKKEGQYAGVCLKTGSHRLSLALNGYGLALNGSQRIRWIIR